MRVMIAASILAFGLTTTTHAGLRYYIDQDVLRKNEAPTLLHRAMRDIGRNPTGWSHRWCGRQMAMWVGEGPNLARDWADYGKAHGPEARRHWGDERTCGRSEGGRGPSRDPGLGQPLGQERGP